ncbi:MULTISPECIES: hypothetical protein [Actinokineospora]|uniref:Uncharacterized protein n=1 Tax=Actinokineospora fastidiosa TaxID=1816 RepID=A0A918LEQ9_9PSEU|nr:MULTISPECIES: hypothetical protein [Actinokineospora]UVS80680.1 hypothetical protein Actkin_04432 [Actinokineospora sp. UTMC 2448]GGS36445.1 hypothetical protein GCM10010171_33960 [Actinokineospora fastidiosa]
MPTLTRLLGAATAAYGAAIVVRPALLASPAGLTNATGEVPGGSQILVRAIGARDAAVGVAMLCAPPGPALRTAVAARVACDLSDAAVFAALPEPDKRRKVVAVAVAWAVLCAIAGSRAS